MTVERTARWQNEWPAWAGDKERLGRLARTMDGLIEQRREQAEEEAVKSTLDEFEEIADRLSSEQYRTMVKEAASRRNERAKERWSTEMTVTEREMSLTLQGAPAEIIEEIDLPFIERLEIAAPADPGAPIRAVVRMSRKEGCSLEVKGSDPAWVSSARDALSTEIGRGVPWWAWLRSKGSVALYFVVAIPIAIAFLLMLAFLLAGNSESQSGENTSAFYVWSVGLLMIALTSVIIASGIQSLARRSLPGFEITPPGSTPKAIRALAFVGGLALSFILSIASNMLTARLFD